MFVEISAIFAYAMAMKLKLKTYSAHAGPKGNRNWNLSHTDDWCQV